jgi:plastocyanin domain-containing protein
MNDLMIIATGIAAIAWVNWYFFFAEGSTGEATAAASGVQEATVRVAGGYTPSQIRLKAGVPAKLHFDRQETSGCSEEVVFPAFGIKRFLPSFKTTDIEFTPSSPGVYEFTCGMGMLKGRLIVEETEGGSR